ncbi:MAG: DMT family transporter [SAR202 cluster bacterium]|nr:DMT family transporter [SAR202 cluster bacterium]
MLDSIIPFAALSSAVWWAVSGAVLKSIRSRTAIVFPFTEAIISGTIIALILIIGSQWRELFSYTLKTYLYMILGSAFSLLGIVTYLSGIKKIPLGIFFTVCIGFQLLSAVGFDIVFNLLIPPTGVLIGGLVIFVGIGSINLSSFELGDKVSVNHNYILGVAFSALAGLFWGIGNFSNDRALIEASAVSAALMRCLGPLIVMGIVILFFRRNEILIINKHDWRLIVAGSFCITIAMLSWFISLSVNSVTVNSIFTSTAPVFAVILGVMFFQEKLKKYEILGIILCLLGTISVILSR